MPRTRPAFEDMKTWTDRVGHTSRRSFTDEHNKFWLEQNPAKNTKWARLARNLPFSRTKPTTTSCYPILLCMAVVLFRTRFIL